MKRSSGKRSGRKTGKSVPILNELGRKDWMVILFITLYIFTFFKPVVSGDGFGYHAVLESVFSENSLNMTGQLRYNEISGMKIIKFYNRTGIYNTHYFFGFPFMSSPAYVLSLYLDDFEAFHIKDGFFLEERGDILVHIASIPFTSIIFFYSGLFACFFLLKRYFSRERAWLAILIMFLSTPIIRYSVYDLSYSHAAETGLMCILLFLFYRGSGKEYLGIILGMLTAMHYSNILIFAPFLLYFLLKRDYSGLTRILAGIVPFIVAIMVYNTVIFGGPLLTGYQGELERSSLLPVHIVQFFTDPHRSVLLWTPGLFLSIPGLLLMRDDRKWVFLLMILLQIYLINCHIGWHGAWGFGHRHFILFFPIYCIGFLELIKRFPKIAYLFYAFAAYTTLMHFIFLVYVEEPLSILHLWSKVNLHDMSRLPAGIYRKIGIVRFLIEV